MVEARKKSREDRPPPLQGAQALAAAPDGHVWLSASAGTGKTHVLTARVLRLLLSGANPESLLCLTFTKAGATEMASRIHERLAAWVQMEDVRLFMELEALGEVGSPHLCRKARELFADVLEATGGGLRIQTIHSFCQQLLGSFPLEAGLAPGFRALDEREAAAIARNALAELVVEVESTGQSMLLDALQALALRAGEDKAEQYLRSCARAHTVLDGIDGSVRDWLFHLLGLPAGDIDAVVAQACGDDAFDMESLDRLIAANQAWGKDSGLKLLDVMTRWRAADPASRAAMIGDLALMVLTKEGEPRKPYAGQIKAEPGYDAYRARVAERCQQLVQLRALADYAALAANALEAGRAFARAYVRAKRKAGAVDYDDLIARAEALLRAPGIAQWIGYKLDQQIDHVLVDEAQDTNSLQWSIIEALTQEFFAGEGAKGDRLRTLFTVGDHKQAIFGFQGTSPRAFAQAQESYEVSAQAVDQPFHALSLDTSFRSMPAVLEVVDATLAVLGLDALGMEPATIRHHAHRKHPGEVVLWHPVAAPGTGDNAEDEAPPGEDGEEWLADQDRVLAERIAAQIAQWLNTGMMLESHGRPVRPGDIMILVRKRGPLSRLIIARLYEAGVPVAGIDRIRLSAPLAVMDLMAALRFAAQPHDDLTLASLLVSPLVGWTQEQLLDHAVPRKGSLWTHLAAKADAPDLSILHDVLAQADFISPYRLLEHILSGPPQGRRRLLARLGEEARDPIDELLQAALTFEQGEQPGLQSFIDWFDREEGDIKRESEGGGDLVRLLTVHGAKGLQAPVVILADATFDPDKAPQDGFALGEVGRASVPLVRPRKGERFGLLEDMHAAAAASERQEHWRLLYVAMTRAEEKLFVTGPLGRAMKGVPPDQSWYAAVERAVIALGGDVADDERWATARGWRGGGHYPSASPKPRATAVRGDVILPDWLREPAPKEERPSRPLAPTAPGPDDTPLPPPDAAMKAAAKRGTLLHSLFERLPDVPGPDRRGAADRWLAGAGDVADADMRRELIDHALGIIEHSDFADLFGPDALAEAPIAAVVGTDVVSGTTDRLLVTDDQVVIVDFKTGRGVPRNAESVPVPHLRQMAAYVAALEAIFPAHVVKAALLYTAAPLLLPLPSALLDPLKPGFAGAQESLA